MNVRYRRDPTEFLMHEYTELWIGDFSNYSMVSALSTVASSGRLFQDRSALVVVLELIAVEKVEDDRRVSLVVDLLSHPRFAK